MRYPYKIDKNDPDKCGQLAGKKLLFGFCSRYAVAPVHTRLAHGVVWFVWDAETVTDAELLAGCFPQIIRQCDTFEDAVEGLS